jgi:hypothetical protein
MSFITILILLGLLAALTTGLVTSKPYWPDWWLLRKGRPERATLAVRLPTDFEKGDESIRKAWPALVSLHQDEPIQVDMHFTGTVKGTTAEIVFSVSPRRLDQVKQILRDSYDQMATFFKLKDGDPLEHLHLYLTNQLDAEDDDEQSGGK